ncbi:MAG: glycosyltransferase family 39 protein [Chitinophagaceae bacterium]|nr:MAG: glycosyltransferase family 39 protein [Chitinophagaceae bacterium]
MAVFIRKNGLIVLMALFILALHLILINSGWELHRDEYLYLMQGNHLAWGYPAVPPTIAFLGFICKLFGYSVFIIRLIPALFGAFTVYMIGRIVIEMKGGYFAQFLACLAYFVTGFLRMNLLFQPNSMDVLYFTICVYYTVRYIHTSSGKYLLYCGILIGLGLLNKYTMALFPIGMLIGLLLTPHRRLFKDRNLYIALLIAFIIFLPNLLWEYFHHFPILIQVHALQGNQLKHSDAAKFIFGQIVNCFPSLFVWIAGLIFYLFAKSGKPYRMFGWIYVTTIVVLIFSNGKDYYAMGTYPMLMAGGGIFLERLTYKVILRWSLCPIMIVAMLWLAIPVLFICIPVFSPAKMARYCIRYKSAGVLHWEDGKDHLLPQDFADMLGWKEMTNKVVSAYISLDSGQKAKTIIFCDNYGEAAAVSIYGRKDHLPQVQSKEGGFILWNPMHQQFDNLILVTDDTSDIHNPLLTENFKQVTEVGAVTDTFAREQGTMILLCQGASEAVIDFINKRQAELRSKY